MKPMASPAHFKYWVSLEVFSILAEVLDARFRGHDSFDGFIQRCHSRVSGNPGSV
jgi:hypothetical protein